MRARSILSTLLAFTALTACDLSPDYKTPKVEIPAAFKQAPPTDTSPITDGKWAASNPAMAEAFGKDEWWKVFGDETLNALVEAAHTQSPTLKAAKARLQQARAFTRAEESRLWPDINLGGNVARQRFSASNPNFPPGVPIEPFTLYSAQASIDYGLDIFGRARNLAKAAQAREVGAAATYRAARIALAADVAEAYYRLRGLRAEEAALARNLALRSETVSITTKRYEIGDVGDLEVARAEGEEASTRAELFAVEQQRAIVEHALAILTGKPPASIEVSTTEIVDIPPEIPQGLPATLLERRPDIVQAEREMAATNAEIGFARGAFFPAVNLGASFGYQASESGSLFDWSSRTWLLGPATGTLLSVPVFSGGRLSANLATSKASFREAVANYRAQVLVAFRETEDALSGVRTANGAAIAQEQAANAAERAYRIARLQYDNGFVGYLERIDAERSLLTAQRGQARARADQYVATITLIRALGGGWDVPVTTPPAAEKTAVTTENPSNQATTVPAETKPVLTLKPDATIPLAKDAPIAWQTLSDKPTPATKTKPLALPFAKRHPKKPVAGLP
jgi:multidrug efflux system outer membrane protein